MTGAFSESVHLGDDHAAMRDSLFVHWAAAAAATAVALLVTQSLVDNPVEKLVAGTAAVLLPLGYLALVAVWRITDARITAARILSGLPTRPVG